MNINAFRNGDLKTSPTAKYIYNGKSFTAKQFDEYIKQGSEEAHDAEPEQATESSDSATTDTKAKKTNRKKRRSSPDTVRHSEGTTEQTTSHVQ